MISPSVRMERNFRTIYSDDPVIINDTSCMKANDAREFGDGNALNDPPG